MSIKLLLADDSITIQKVIGIIFGGEDYSLTVVDNGKAALEKALELNPDVLVIDALMPGMSGYEVCEAVRATPALASKPILILTGSFEPFDEEKARKSGADDFLAKPFESQQIVNKVKELAVLGAARASNALTAAPAVSPEPAVVAPAVSILEPEPAPPQDELQSEPPSDVWGVFTPDTETETPTDVTMAPEPAETPLSDTFEPDVFAMINEDSDSELVSSASEPSTSHQHTGTQWIPVEEHTFEFVDENVAEIPQTAFSEQTDLEQDSGFGEIAFEEEASDLKTRLTTAVAEPAVSDFMMPEPEPEPEITTTVEEPAPSFEPEIVAFEPPAPVFAAPTPGFTEPVVPPVAATVTTAPETGALSEEQLRAAIMSASKEVIERIVWEVVPDLAENLIREAIRKIKEGA